MMVMILDYELPRALCFISMVSLNPCIDLVESEFKEETTNPASQWQLSLKLTS